MQNVTDADGSFRYGSHSNGDVSVFQWSLPDLVWTHLGRIDHKDASSFQSFFNASTDTCMTYLSYS